LFLQSIALMTDLDVASGTPKVRLSTIHSAKGLEFDHVFLPAWEAGVFPSQRAMESGASGKPEDRWDGPVGGGVVEERRLAHVALTRARDSVEVSYALTRTSSRASGGPSSLVAEANLQLMEAPGGDLRELKPSRRQKIAGGKGFARRRH
jgi:DNA helicase-2/ATP-dependent DNA helicase PcrA